MAHPTARWRARSASLILSVAAHVVLLAALLASLSVRPPPQQIPMIVQLVAPALTPRRTRTPKPEGDRTAAAQAPAQASATAAQGVPAPAGPVAPSAPAPGADGDLARVRGMLRGALGCGHPGLVKLTEAERAACDRKMAAGINPNVAWPANIDPEKRAWFDATLTARNSPGRIPGFGCAAGRPPHSVKLGPLPCFIVPPKGPLDEDVDVPPPSKNGPSYLGMPLRPPPPIPDFGNAPDR